MRQTAGVNRGKTPQQNRKQCHKSTAKRPNRTASPNVNRRQTAPTEPHRQMHAANNLPRQNHIIRRTPKPNTPARTASPDARRAPTHNPPRNTSKLPLHTAHSAEPQAGIRRIFPSFQTFLPMRRPHLKAFTSVSARKTPAEPSHFSSAGVLYAVVARSRAVTAPL